MGFWDKVKTRHGFGPQAHSNRFLRYGWIVSYIYFLIVLAMIFSFIKKAKFLSADPTLATMSSTYICLAVLMFVGYGMRRSFVMLPMLAFQVAVHIWAFLQSRQISEIAARREFIHHYSPYYTGWIFGIGAFVYIYNHYDEIED
jgi:hypothetical protein